MLAEGKRHPGSASLAHRTPKATYVLGTRSARWLFQQARWWGEPWSFLQREGSRAACDPREFEQVTSAWLHSHLLRDTKQSFNSFAPVFYLKSVTTFACVFKGKISIHWVACLCYPPDPTKSNTVPHSHQAVPMMSLKHHLQDKCMKISCPQSLGCQERAVYLRPWLVQKRPSKCPEFDSNLGLPWVGWGAPHRESKAVTEPGIFHTGQLWLTWEVAKASCGKTTISSPSSAQNVPSVWAVWFPTAWSTTLEKIFSGKWGDGLD
jgi:hypothetical protein